MGTVSFRMQGEQQHFSLVSGWDSSTGWATEQGIESTGEIYTVRWAKMSATVDEGESVGTAEGKKTAAFEIFNLLSYSMAIASVGQESAASWQQPASSQLAPSTTTALSSFISKTCGQISAHTPQPMHAS